jgi:hypothetical protein
MLQVTPGGRFLASSCISACTAFATDSAFAPGSSEMPKDATGWPFKREKLP